MKPTMFLFLFSLQIRFLVVKLALIFGALTISLAEEIQTGTHIHLDPLKTCSLSSESMLAQEGKLLLIFCTLTSELAVTGC